jgi:uncharacterized protein YegL
MSKGKAETLVVFVLDKSGSMSSVEAATRSGFNEYIGTLKKDKQSKYAFSLTLFDTEVTKRYTNVRLAEVEDLDSKNYRPDGMTALYDAVMQTVNETAKSVTDDQKILCVIMTDGEENSSKEYTDKDLKQRIKELEGKNWSFVFLGANQDSWAVGQKFGLARGNVVNFVASDAGVAKSFATVARSTSMYACSADLNTQSFFSEKDREDLENAQ